MNQSQEPRNQPINLDASLEDRSSIVRRDQNLVSTTSARSNEIHTKWQVHTVCYVDLAVGVHPVLDIGYVLAAYFPHNTARRDSSPPMLYWIMDAK